MTARGAYCIQHGKEKQTVTEYIKLKYKEQHQMWNIVSHDWL